MALSCETVNDLFVRESGRYAIDIHERFTLDSVWGRLIRVGKFPQQMGTSINELTIERIMTGEFEDDWQALGVSSGETISAGCIPDPKDLSFGSTVIPWGLEERSYRTPCVCLDDLKTSFQIRDQVSKTVRQLTRAQKEVLENRRRSAYLALTQKWSAGTGYTTESDMADVPVPTSVLTQGLLEFVRLQALRDGAGEDAIGMENGAPILGLITSPETSAALIRQDSSIREDVRYAEPSELVAPLGVRRSFGGFYHLVDMNTPRFIYDAGADPGEEWTRVYPYVKVAATNGFKWETNPAYVTAPYEASFIFNPNVYEEAVQYTGPQFPDAPFDDYPYYYNGQVHWVNIKHDKRNPLGKIGFWMLLFQNGVRPIAPYLGHTIIHKRCNVTDYIICPGDEVEEEEDGDGGDI